MGRFSIVFMGTPEFAVSVMNKLYKEEIEIKAIVTAPDKPAGRGRKLNQSEVKKFAIDNKLNILQPTNLKDASFIENLKELNADLFVVVAFRMLPESVWTIPPFGTVNLHASLLPNYRGAAPINWAIINGETESGVTTFFIEKEIDTGRIIDQTKVQIGENETAGELYNRLMQKGADLMYETVQKIFDGKVTSMEQSELNLTNIKPAPKIFRDNCKIDFSLSVAQIHDFCRGLSPSPAAWCQLYNHEKDEVKIYKLFETRKTTISCSCSQSIVRAENGILFPCSDYYMLVTEIKPEGKRKMTFKEFLAGNTVENMSLFGNPE
jgi:methionyl-tRNA formyltransferase